SDAEVERLKESVRDQAVRRAAAQDDGAQGAMDATTNGQVTSDTTNLHDVQLKAISGFDPSAARPKSVILNGDIDVVFLPDLDEQYAMKSKNFLSKSAFGVVFKDGWQLTDVQAEHDSTPVAIELLNTISKAVDAAKTIATAGLSAGGGPAP